MSDEQKLIDSIKGLSNFEEIVGKTVDQIKDDFLYEIEADLLKIINSELDAKLGIPRKEYTDNMRIVNLGAFITEEIYDRLQWYFKDDMTYYDEDSEEINSEEI